MSCNGTAITYDAVGNPTKWRNAVAIEWYGKQMSLFAHSDGSVTNCSYDADGIRTSKYYYDADGNITGTVKYTLDGSAIVAENRNGTNIYQRSGVDVSNNATHIANINPFRYRGYYCDTETGFYYLQSRYYDPEVGRFLNADAIVGANGGVEGCNCFAYCNNNPVAKYDPTGYNAIYLTDDDSHGHTGIMVQDEKGVWYHFYWGPKNVAGRFSMGM